MNIPARFEFHYVQNGVKKSVTLFTQSLFKRSNAGQAQQTALPLPHASKGCAVQ